jgi:hypothetical protein
MRFIPSLLLFFITTYLSAQYSDFEKVMTGPGGHFGRGMTDNNTFVFIGSEADIMVYRKDSLEYTHVQDLDFPLPNGGFMDAAENTLVIGLTRDATHGEDAGAVMIFEYNGSEWVPYGKIFSDDLEEFDGFGGEVSVDGDWLAAGAKEHNMARGAAYLFHRESGQWVQRHKIVPSDLELDSRFGGAVAIDGEWLAIGAAGFESEAVYTYKRNGNSWPQKQRIHTMADQVAFGSAVKLDKENLFIAAEATYQGNKVNTGKVFMYERSSDSFFERASFSSHLLKETARMGSWIDLEGDYAIAGAHMDDPAGVNSGSAFIFKKLSSGQWIELKRLVPTTAIAHCFFGFNPVIDGDKFLVPSASNSTTFDLQKGFVYIISPPFRDINIPNQTNRCVSSQSFDIDESTYEWITIMGSGQVLYELNPQGNILGTINTRIFYDEDPYAIDALGLPVCRRIISIQPDAQPQSPVRVRMYFLWDEIEALLDADPDAETIHDLKLAKVNATCDSIYHNDGKKVQIERIDSYGDNFFIEFQTTSFSTFYLVALDQQVTSAKPDVYDNTDFKLVSNIVLDELAIAEADHEDTFNIFTMQGRILFSAMERYIPVDALPTGIYFVSNGRSALKFVKL